MKRKYFFLIIIASISITSIATSFLMSINGTVVDAETGKPVEGAIVLVEWTRRVGPIDYHTTSVRAAEAITDVHGHFHVFGPIHPFVDPVNVTVYKKGYVAWNNKYVFPGFVQRNQMESVYDQIQLERFQTYYSHEKHVFFIGSCILSTLAYNDKKVLSAAFEWEIDLAREERKTR
jgi:hypothetical protein